MIENPDFITAIIGLLLTGGSALALLIVIIIQAAKMKKTYKVDENSFRAARETLFKTVSVLIIVLSVFLLIFLITFNFDIPGGTGFFIGLAIFISVVDYLKWTLGWKEEEGN